MPEGVLSNLEVEGPGEAVGRASGYRTGSEDAVLPNGGERGDPARGVISSGVFQASPDVETKPLQLPPLFCVEGWLHWVPPSSPPPPRP